MEKTSTGKFIDPLNGDSAIAFEAGAALAGAFKIGDGVDGVMVPAGFAIESLERFNAAPADKRGALTFGDVASLARYVKAHAGPGSSIYWDKTPTPSVVAVLDHHAPGATGSAGWGRHTARLKFTNSRAWDEWMIVDGKAQTQAHFAEFVEDHLDDIAEPAGADLLELAKRFSVTRAVTFEGAINLANGNTELRYAETDATKGAIAIPPGLVLGLTPFDGDPRYRVEARLRYRIDAGKLTLTVKLVRPLDVVETAIADRIKALAAGTGLAPYCGHPGPAPVAL